MKQRVKSSVAIVGAAAVFFAADELFAQVTWNPVAVTGAPATDVPGATYQQFHNQLALDDTGRVAFVSELAGVGVDSSNKWTLHFGQPGSSQLTARQGQPTPGASGQLVFGNFDNNPFQSLSAAGGRLAFSATARPVADPLDSRYTVFTTTGGALQPVLPTGTLPGMRPSEVAREVNFPEVLNQDVVRVSALLTPDLGDQCAGRNRGPREIQRPLGGRVRGERARAWSGGGAHPRRDDEAAETAVTGLR